MPHVCASWRPLDACGRVWRTCEHTHTHNRLLVWFAVRGIYCCWTHTRVGGGFGVCECVWNKHATQTHQAPRRISPRMNKSEYIVCFGNSRKPRRVFAFRVCLFLSLALARILILTLARLSNRRHVERDNPRRIVYLRAARSKMFGFSIQRRRCCGILSQWYKCIYM